METGLTEAVEALHRNALTLREVNLTKLGDGEFRQAWLLFEKVCLILTGFVANRMIAEVAARNLPMMGGFRAMIRYLKEQLRISGGEAHRRARDSANLAYRSDFRGENLPSRYPHITETQHEGEITLEHAHTIIDVLRRVPQGMDDGTNAEKAAIMLTTLATKTGPEDVKLAGGHMLGYLNPDGHATSDIDRARHRGLRLANQDLDLMTRLGGQLDPQTRALLDVILAKWAAPGANNFDDPESPRGNLDTADVEPALLEAAANRDHRTQEQRNHDALKALLLTTLNTGIPPEPLPTEPTPTNATFDDPTLYELGPGEYRTNGHGLDGFGAHEYGASECGVDGRGTSEFAVDGRGDDEHRANGRGVTEHGHRGGARRSTRHSVCGGSVGHGGRGSGDRGGNGCGDRSGGGGGCSDDGGRGRSGDGGSGEHGLGGQSRRGQRGGERRDRTRGLGEHNGLPMHIVVTMTASDLAEEAGVATTATGTTIPVRDVLAMAARKRTYLLLFDDRERPLHFFHERRTANLDQRLVLFATERGCTFPGCRVPAAGCQAHHRRRDHRYGSDTGIHDLTLACPYDHAKADPNDGIHTPNGWHTRVGDADGPNPGRTHWVPPASVDPDRKPKLNNSHHPDRLLADAGALLQARREAETAEWLKARNHHTLTDQRREQEGRWDHHPNCPCQGCTQDRHSKPSTPTLTA